MGSITEGKLDDYDTGRGLGQLASGVNFNPAFREPEWQSLHAAALALLTDALHDAAEAHEQEEEVADSAESIWQVGPPPLAHPNDLQCSPSHSSSRLESDPSRLSCDPLVRRSGLSARVCCPILGSRPFTSHLLSQ